MTFKGTRIENEPPHKITGRGIVLVPEREKVFPNLTVAGKSRGSRVPRAARSARSAPYHFFPRLRRTARGRTAGLLSGGERQMLAIGAALMCRPQLLLVDELSLGLAPVVVQDLTRRLRSIRDELGIGILLVEQSAAAALEIADYAYRDGKRARCSRWRS